MHGVPLQEGRRGRWAGHARRPLRGSARGPPVFFFVGGGACKCFSKTAFGGQSVFQKAFTELHSIFKFRNVIPS